MRVVCVYVCVCRLLLIQLVSIHVSRCSFSTACTTFCYNIVDDCMRRWKALRERFARELKKKKKKSGDPADNSPPWPYFDQLLFLKEFIKHRRYFTCCIFILKLKIVFIEGLLGTLTLRPLKKRAVISPERGRKLRMKCWILVQMWHHWIAPVLGLGH